MQNLKGVNQATSLTAKFVIAILLVLVLSFASLSCQKSSEAKVKVRTGTRIVCKYGELLQDNTRLVLVSKSEASNYRVRTVRKLCLKHRRAENLYKQAERALVEGERDKAQGAFKKIMELDPKFRDTRKRLASVNETIVKQEIVSNPSAGASPQEPTSVAPIPSTGGSSSSATPEPGVSPEGPQGSAGTPSSGDGASQGTGTSTFNVDLVLLLPGSLSGYRTGGLSKSDIYASRDYTPQGKKEQLVEFLLITIHRMKNDNEATTFLDRVSRRVFYANAQEVNLRSDRTAYYGTDETTYANVSWYDRNLVYEVQMMSATGSPKDLYSEIVEVAKQVP